MNFQGIAPMTLRFFEVNLDEIPSSENFFFFGFGGLSFFEKATLVISLEFEL